MSNDDKPQIDSLQWPSVLLSDAVTRLDLAGEVTERLKVHDWKSCVPLIRVPGVRIPPSPPGLLFLRR